MSNLKDAISVINKEKEPPKVEQEETNALTYTPWVGAEPQKIPPSKKPVVELQTLIKTMRKAKGLTQRQLAAKAGTSQTTISRAEKISPYFWVSPDILVAIAEALDSKLTLIPK